MLTRRSGIWVEKDERRVNAKSLLGVLSLGIVKGTTITLIADGSAAPPILPEISQTLGKYSRKYGDLYSILAYATM